MCLTEKPINDLLGMNFFIPSYQRGYRWTQPQVQDLLDDIKEFMEKPRETWYCLQPLVVKKSDNDKNRWEVIDGQQRLTTIYIILASLGHSEKFSITYETREGSADFLEKISIEKKEENIDYYHIVNTKEQVEKFFEKNNQLQKKFLETLLNEVKFIWYESVDEDPVKVFTRLNIGKIPLTNAELIKALFLNSSNFGQSNDLEKIRQKQFEIASEWDSIENKLQDDAFWYFINKEENIKNTRIEFIFDLIADDQKNIDPFSTFRYFFKEFKSISEQEIPEYWKKIKNYYNRINEWFTDRNIYHLIGYLISIGTDIREIIKNSIDKTKSEFRDYLQIQIKKEICVNIDELKYGENSSMIRKILLFHNIQTMLNNENESNRFPFDRYKKEKWDIEHIRAIAEEMPNDRKHQIDWLNDAKVFIADKDILEAINIYVNSVDDKNNSEVEPFENLFNIVINYFNNSGLNEDTIDDISNLVLLDEGTNRSYKNAVFPVKRKTIINREKIGTFIPVCTKNVFLKLYSEDLSQMSFWGEKDRKCYIKDIKETLKFYLPTQNVITHEQ